MGARILDVLEAAAWILKIRLKTADLQLLPPASTGGVDAVDCHLVVLEREPERVSTALVRSDARRA